MIIPRFWWGTSPRNNSNGLITVDANGSKELETSPASTLKPTLNLKKGAPPSSMVFASFPFPQLNTPADTLATEAKSGAAPPASNVFASLAFPPELSMPMESEKAVDFFPMLEKSDWVGIADSLKELESPEQRNVLEASLGKTNESQETIIHAVCSRGESVTALRLLNAVPPNRREHFLLAKDNAGNTPLHLACANMTNPKKSLVIKALVKLVPNSLRKPNANGDLPLHLMISSPSFQTDACADIQAELAAEELISNLLETLPGLPMKQNENGATLLHSAISNKAYERVMLALLHKCPQVACIADQEQSVPLHCIAKVGGIPWTFCEELIKAFPRSLTAQDLEGSTPLHVLLSNACTLRSDNSILDRNTTKLAELLSRPLGQHVQHDEAASALLVLNKNGFSPLHVCAACTVPSQLTRILRRSSFADEASELTNDHSETPLHLACASSAFGTTPDALQNLKELTTEPACLIFDDTHRTPIMVAMGNAEVPTTALNYLLDICPEAAQMESSSGNLPLHTALQSNVNKSIVKRIIKVFPEGAEKVLSNGNTALHLACSNPATSASTIKHLLDVYPDAAIQTNDEGYTPYKYVKTNTKLLKKSPELLTWFKTQPNLDSKGTLRRKEAFVFSSAAPLRRKEAFVFQN